MCGRYALFGGIPDHVLAKLVGFDPVDEHGAKLPFFEFDPRWNIAPTQKAPVVRTGEDGRRRFELLRWGLVPHWAEDLRFGAKCVNARVETAATKPAFRDAWRRRRCLVPATGFYEWTTTKPKRAFFYRRADGDPLLFAGLWDSWTDRATGEVIDTFTILTRTAYDVVRPVHERSPSALPPESWDAWLAGQDVGDVPPPELVAVPVGDAVGNPRAEGPELLTSPVA